jgi:DinB superfamily
MDIREAILTQYSSALAMLEKAIELCPDTLWFSASGSSPNRYWHIAYHSLFYVHFYLAPTEAEFVPWQHQRFGYNFLGAVPWKTEEPLKIDQPYTQTELLEYAAFCREEAAVRVPALDLEAPSGFHWLPFNKLTLQFYIIRHLAHHTGQLGERLRSQANIGLPWLR